MYQLVKNGNGIIDQVKRLIDHAWIPMDENNKDYQEYLKWIEEGNTPEPAEETE